MVKQIARLDGEAMSGSGVVEITTEEAVTIQKAALIMLMQATPERRLTHVSLPEKYRTGHIRAVYQNLPEFDEQSLKARETIVKAALLLQSNLAHHQDVRSMIDAWRDEWHLEPEPEMDGHDSKVYESLVTHVSALLATRVKEARAEAFKKVEESVWLATKDFKGVLNEVQRRAIALAAATYAEAAAKGDSK